MKLQRESAVDYLSNSIQSYFQIKEWKDIISFAQQDIDLSGDISSAKDRIQFQNYPYMIDILKSCVIEKGVRKQVVLMGIDQLGKTTIQLIALLYNCCYNTLQSIVAYPSDDLAIETATVKFLPLFKSIPQFQSDLEKPFAIRSDRFRLSNAIVYWAGAGAKIVSKSCKLVIGDQCALWSCPNTNNLNQLKKRTRSYNECLQLFLSTPRYKTDAFSRQFFQSSQGYYTLRCQNCGQLTMRSCDIHNLQFETVYDQQLKQYVVIKGSERLICPQCRFQHDQSYRQNMVKQGGYVHRFPNLMNEFAGFQVGSLASLLNVHSWSNIANVQLSSGKESTLQDFISFDASIRGLPYQQREYNKQDESALQKHFYKQQQLKPEEWEAVYVVSDTQDLFLPYGVFALDFNNNIWCLELGRKTYMYLNDDERKIINSQNIRNNRPPQVTLLDILEKDYYGFKPLMLFQDGHGHRTEDVKRFAQQKKNILIYMGTHLRFDKFKIGQGNHKMFFCDAKSYQAQLIFRLYFQNNKQRNYLFIPQNISEKDIQEITSFQPDKTKRNGNQYQNWDCGVKIHDMFDVFKMCLAAIQISSKIFRPDRFKHYKANVFQKNKPKKTSLQKPQKHVERKSVFRNKF